MTDNERAILAREVAADGYYGSSRSAFIAGWEAALEWKEKHDAPQLEQQAESGRPRPEPAA